MVPCKWYYDNIKIVAGSRYRKPATILFVTSGLAHETQGARRKKEKYEEVGGSVLSVKVLGTM